MRVTDLINQTLVAGAPLTSPFLALLAALAVPAILRRANRTATRVAWIALVVGAFWVAYAGVARYPAAARWLARLNTPLVTVYLLVVLPAALIPPGRLRKWFQLVPAAVLALAVVSVFEAYQTVPTNRTGFYWILIRPAFLIGGVASLLVLVQPLLSLKWFRRAVRLACFLVLVYGGFALRQNYRDYERMLSRRRDAKPDIMNISETSPVLQQDNRMLYPPSAPCRFTADGGYVQGCNMELLQRVMQVDWRGVAARDPAELNALAVGMAALVLFLILCFLSGRWTCGWLCPLSTLGDLFDAVRRALGAPHLKPTQPVKLAYLGSGLGLAGVTLAMAKAYPHLDASGTFAGCKLPLYPFCKICPSQQVCPVAAGGPGNYAGLPTWDWGFGFFRVAVLALLGVFFVSFMTGRRLWCRLCPMGMIAGLFNRGGMLRLSKDAQKCNRCGVCAEVCPMDIDLVRAEMKDTDVSSFDCVLCGKCVDHCPRDGCLAIEHGGVRIVESRFEAKAE